MSEEKKDALIDVGLMEKKKSQLREEVEQALQKKGISEERRISVIKLETKEAHYFDDYVQAMQYLKGKKGRWYLATPGIRRQ